MKHRQSENVQMFGEMLYACDQFDRRWITPNFPQLGIQNETGRHRLLRRRRSLEPMPRTAEISDHLVFDVYKCNCGEFTSKEISSHARMIGALKGYGPYISSVALGTSRSNDRFRTLRDGHNI